MKIKLIEPGFEKFSGDFGPVPFHNGVSVRDVTAIEASRIANSIRAETVEGKPRNPSDSQLVLESRAMKFDPEMVHSEVAMIKEGKTNYSRDELERIADKQGIRGIRDIAEPLGLRSNAIEKLIEMILDLQSPGTKTVSNTAPKLNDIVSIELPHTSFGVNK